MTILTETIGRNGTAASPPIAERVEISEEVMDRSLEAVAFVPHERLGATDECGFTHFSLDPAMSRANAFAKAPFSRSGTELAGAILGGSR